MSYSKLRNVDYKDRGAPPAPPSGSFGETPPSAKMYIHRMIWTQAFDSLDDLFSTPQITALEYNASEFNLTEDKIAGKNATETFKNSNPNPRGFHNGEYSEKMRDGQHDKQRERDEEDTCNSFATLTELLERQLEDDPFFNAYDNIVEKQVDKSLTESLLERQYKDGTEHWTSLLVEQPVVKKPPSSEAKCPSVFSPINTAPSKPMTTVASISPLPYKHQTVEVKQNRPRYIPTNKICAMTFPIKTTVQHSQARRHKNLGVSFSVYTGARRNNVGKLSSSTATKNSSTSIKYVRKNATVVPNNKKFRFKAPPRYEHSVTVPKKRSELGHNRRFTTATSNESFTSKWMSEAGADVGRPGCDLGLSQM